MKNFKPKTLKPPESPWWASIVMLHHSPLAAAPAGTRPWTLGSGLEPGPHWARGTASNEGESALTTGV